VTRPQLLLLLVSLLLLLLQGISVQQRQWEKQLQQQWELWVLPYHLQEGWPALAQGSGRAAAAAAGRRSLVVLLVAAAAAPVWEQERQAPQP
jgi:hypothetical protein